MLQPIMTEAEVSNMAQSIEVLLPPRARYLLIVATREGVKVLGTVPQSQVPAFLREVAANSKQEPK